MAAWFIISGCASYKINEAQYKLRSSFADHNFNQTLDLLQKFEHKGIYKSKENVLFDLEMGMANHFDGRYDSSTVYFTKAEDEMDRLYTKSISRGIYAFLLSNDNALAYNGEDYEDLYLNAFKSLNFIHQGDIESALVEARRISFKLSQLEIKYKGIASALSKADTLKRTDWEAGSTNFHNSAFAHYLAALLYAKSGKADDARIEYDKLKAAFSSQPSIYAFKAPDSRALERLTKPQSYNLLVTAFAGRAPIKKQHDVRLYLPDPDLYLKFSLPSLYLFPSQVHAVHITVDDSLTAPAYLLEEMDSVAKEVYKVKEPIIYGRAFVRSFVKAVGSNMISKSVEKKNKGLAAILNILGKAGQELSEQADLRGWQTMPGKVYANVLKLQPGAHEITINYYGRGNTLLYSVRRKLIISPSTKLKLAEGLYWN